MTVMARLTAFVCLLLVAAAGLASLAVPLNGDTALFHFGAGRLLAGDTLYLHWWDLKAPGVYGVHVIARLLFGEGHWAIHALAVILALVVAAALPALLRPALHRPALAALAPLLVVLPYFLAAGEWHQSQPALFAAFALVLGLAGLTRGGALAALLGGVGLALAISIKLSAIAPALAMWVLAGRGRRGAALVGLALGLGATASILALTGGLGDAVDTLTRWREAADDVLPGATVSHLPEAAHWYATHHAGVLAAALAGLLLLILRPAGGPDGRFWRVVAGWLFFGLAGIALERFAGWPFDFFLVSIPLGLLAVAAIDHAFVRVPALAGPGGALLAAAAAVALAAPAAPAWWQRTQGATLPAALAALIPAVPTTLGVSRTAPPGAGDDPVAAALGPLDTLPGGPIYVFGDPRIQLASQRPMAGTVHGWAWELQPPDMSLRLLADWLGTPPAAILIAAPYGPLLAARHEVLHAWIRTHYEPGPSTASGTWWIRRAEPAPQRNSRQARPDA